MRSGYDRPSPQLASKQASWEIAYCAGWMCNLSLTGVFRNINQDINYFFCWDDVNSANAFDQG